MKGPFKVKSLFCHEKGRPRCRSNRLSKDYLDVTFMGSGMPPPIFLNAKTEHFRVMFEKGLNYQESRPAIFQPSIQLFELDDFNIQHDLLRIISKRIHITEEARVKR